MPSSDARLFDDMMKVRVESMRRLYVHRGGNGMRSANPWRYQLAARHIQLQPHLTTLSEIEAALRRIDIPIVARPIIACARIFRLLPFGLAWL